MKRTAVVRRLSSKDASSGDAANELFASAGWPVIKKDLDECPVFTVANKKGQPLQYSVGGAAMPFFFCCVEFIPFKVECNRIVLLRQVPMAHTWKNEV